MFHIVKNQLRDEVIRKNLEAESFLEFQERVLCAIESIPSDVIDKTIESLSKRVEAIIKSGGYRSKYRCISNSEAFMT